MSCENGPAILYYLSQNLSEADRIVKSALRALLLLSDVWKLYLSVTPR
jgi:hypothetical protein